MDSHTLMACLGQQVGSPQLQAVLEKLGIALPIRTAKGELHARKNLLPLGLSLIFETASPGQLVLGAVQFLSSEEGGGAGYLGALPGGLLFSDDPMEARQKLGPPHSSDAELCRDSWSHGGYRLVIKFRKAEPHRIGAVTVQTASDD